MGVETSWMQGRNTIESSFLVVVCVRVCVRTRVSPFGLLLSKEVIPSGYSHAPHDRKVERKFRGSLQSPQYSAASCKAPVETARTAF